MTGNRARRSYRSINLPLAILALIFSLTLSFALQPGAVVPGTINAAVAQESKLTADDAEAGDSFGASVAVSGNTAIVGAEFDDIEGQSDQGSAYIFVNNGGVWTQQAKLIAENGFRADRFGHSVAISGDTAVVGAIWDGDKGIVAGAIYVFVRENNVWTQQAKLTASDGDDFGLFGGSVAISGNTIVAGSIGDDEKGGLAGAAYVFLRQGDTWTEQAKLTASDGAEEDEFGGSASISGETVVVGAEFDNVGNILEQGSAYVFTRNGTVWTQQAKLLPDDGEEEHSFGDSVSISGNTVVVGASFDSVGNNPDQGSAYIFERSGTAWTQRAKLTSSDGASEDFFGSSVSISGDKVVIGSHRSNSNGSQDTGAAYIFVRRGANWSQQEKLIASDRAMRDFFGKSVSISGNNVLAGAAGDDLETNEDQGSAYVFILEDPPTNIPPTVSLIKPKDGKSLPAGKTKVKIKAEASDSDGTVVKVEFFQGDTKLAEDTTSPYVFKWKNAPSGTHTITVRATDNRGAVTISTSARVTVNAGG